MAKIYKRSDRIKVKIDDTVVTIAPLTFEQKARAQSIMERGNKTNDVDLITKGIVQLIKYGVKDISGVEDLDGNPYKLSFDGEELKDECIDDLFNIEIYPKLMLVCTSLATSIPTAFVGIDGKPVDGVEILPRKKESSDPN